MESPITSEQRRTITLRDERSGRETRRLWAYLDEAGALHIDGQDLGRATAPVSDDGEYEWFSTICAANVPRLMELLGGETGTDVLNLLAVQCTADGAYQLERTLRASGIPIERFVY